MQPFRTVLGLLKILVMASALELYPWILRSNVPASFLLKSDFGRR